MIDPNDPNVQASIAAGKAIVDTVAPFVPYGQLADTLLTQGLQYWANFQQKKTAGQLTQADVEAAASALNVDMAALLAARAAQKAQET